MELVTVDTGQHYDRNMAAGFVEELGLPEFQRTVHTRGLRPHEQIGLITSTVGRHVVDFQPSCVCVFGDTNSTLGAAIGAMAAGCPVVHIEAGARSFDASMPEELNRRMVDHCADLLLTVSSNCTSNLLRERVPGSVVEVGDPLYEVFLGEWKRSSTADTTRAIDQSRCCLLTLHRRALLENRAMLKLVLDSVSELAIEESLEVFFPLHPHTERVLNEYRIQFGPGITPTAPLLYGAMIKILRSTALVITDSGGLQKEAFWAGRPCVTLRPNTEWRETIDAGANCLADAAALGRVSREMLRRTLSEAHGITDPYHGLGSSVRIAAAIAERYV